MYRITSIVGLALIVAPFILSYTGDLVATAVNMGVGVTIMLVSLVKAVMQDMDKWEYGVVAFLGLLAIMAPFALGFRGDVRPLDASLILGVIVIALAGYQVFIRSSAPQ